MVLFGPLTTFHFSTLIYTICENEIARSGFELMAFLMLWRLSILLLSPIPTAQHTGLTVDTTTTGLLSTYVRYWSVRSVKLTSLGRFVIRAPEPRAAAEMEPTPLVPPPRVGRWPVALVHGRGGARSRWTAGFGRCRRRRRFDREACVAPCQPPARSD